MSEIRDLLNSPTAIILSVAILIFALMKIDSAKAWVKTKLEEYRANENRAEVVSRIIAERDEQRQGLDTLSDSMTTISAAMQQHAAALQTITTSLDGINDRLDRAEEERREDTIASGRASLQHLYEALKDKPSLTINEYETFGALAERYLNAGGNGPFKQKIIPEVLAKPVDDDGK